LAERGLNLNLKEVHGIGQYAGQAALTYRRRELELYREGKLPAAEGRGKRFGAMIDGGRTKIRTMKRKQKGCGETKTQKRRFQTDWREPKQIIVFEMDDQGRMKKGTKPILDGTFQGPDQILEVLAMRLHQVGASQAEVIAFRADGTRNQKEYGHRIPSEFSCRPGEQLPPGASGCRHRAFRPRCPVGRAALACREPFQSRFIFGVPRNRACPTFYTHPRAFHAGVVKKCALCKGVHFQRVRITPGKSRSSGSNRHRRRRVSFVGSHESLDYHRSDSSQSAST
jgi:hypothetical protein